MYHYPLSRHNLCQLLADWISPLPLPQQVVISATPLTGQKAESTKLDHPVLFYRRRLLVVTVATSTTWGGRGVSHRRSRIYIRLCRRCPQGNVVWRKTATLRIRDSNSLLKIAISKYFLTDGHVSSGGSGGMGEFLQARIQTKYWRGAK